MWKWRGSPSPSSEGSECWEYLISSVVAGPAKQIKVWEKEGGGGGGEEKGDGGGKREKRRGGGRERRGGRGEEGEEEDVRGRKEKMGVSGILGQ